MSRDGTVILIDFLSIANHDKRLYLVEYEVAMAAIVQNDIFFLLLVKAHADIIKLTYNN